MDTIIMELIILLITPLIAMALFWVSSNRIFINTVNIAGSSVTLATTVLIVKETLDKGCLKLDIFNDLFYVDSFSGLLLLITAFIGLLVSVYSIGYMGEELNRGVISMGKFKKYFSLFHGFVFTMLLTTTVQNMGVIWIAVEATTLASAFLVGFYNNKKSIEAAWKYIIICSVGIAFALLGIVLLYYSSVQSLGQSASGLNWQFLFSNADKLQGSILRISFIFILMGFGTKVGLAPMHTWLPDAHSQAPSPISALLSGVLLNTAMYGIVRVMIIVNKNTMDSLFTGRLLMVFGILSIGTASIFIMVQKDFKRILAYSSIEHMGIIALGFGMLSPLSVFGALFHIVNHSLTKSMLFLSSGNVYLKYETKKINQVQGILKTLPVTGVVFLLGIFAITGMPPFSVFTSELYIIVSSFKEAHYFIAALLLLFLILVFAGFMTRMVRMFFGSPLNEETETGEFNVSGTAVLAALLVIIAFIGLFLPTPLKMLIDNSREIIINH